jgi:transcription antitermination factor NusG
VAAYLDSRALEHLLLVRKETRQWSDRRKTVAIPIFPGYVFCRLDFDKRAEVLSIPGVLKIVGNGRVATPVADEEITALHLLHKSKRPLSPAPYLQQGDLVRIDHGPLDGLTGRFMRVKSGCRVVVLVTILQRAVAVELEESQIEELTHCPREPWLDHSATSSL